MGEGARKAKASKKRRKASVAATGGLKAGETREEVDIDREDSTATSSCGGGSSGDDQRGTALAGESKSPGFFAADPRHHSAEMYEQSNRSAEGRSDRHSATRARFSIIPRETRSAARRKQVMAGGGSCETTSSDPPAGMAKRQQAGLFGSRKKQRVDRGELSGGVQGEKRESALALTCAIGVGPKKELSASTAYLVAGEWSRSPQEVVKIPDGRVVSERFSVDETILCHIDPRIPSISDPSLSGRNTPRLGVKLAHTAHCILQTSNEPANLSAPLRVARISVYPVYSPGITVLSA